MSVFALVDGNSFYCSCERAFDPRLRGKPVVVLSNNDGCAIARTDEAKALGIKMGDPWHLVRGKPALKDVVWKSSNYALYGDMSRRMFEVLCSMSPRVEPYSIDEMFLDLSGMPGDLEAHCRAIRAQVRRVVKIPTCVGIGPTKTIAKLANKMAKADRTGAGVCDFRTEDARALAYPTIDLSDVWGLGRASTAKLKKLGIEKVSDFIRLSPDQVRDMLTVTGLRTLKELKGVSCMPLSLAPPTRKSLAVTRSFGRPITDWSEMREAVTAYATRAGEKLRRHRLSACAMQVFMRTNEFAATPQYANQVTIDVEPTADSLALIGSAVRMARSLWREGFSYAKAGVILVDLSQAAELPNQLFPTRDPVKSEALMGALDRINLRFGTGTLRPGAIAQKPDWSMRRANLSPSYTTRPEDILCAKA